MGYKTIVAREGSFARCEHCPAILVQRDGETADAFSKRDYCSRKCRDGAARWRMFCTNAFWG